MFSTKSGIFFRFFLFLRVVEQKLLVLWKKYPGLKNFKIGQRIRLSRSEALNSTPWLYFLDQRKPITEKNHLFWRPVHWNARAVKADIYNLAMLYAPKFIREGFRCFLTAKRKEWKLKFFSLHRDQKKVRQCTLDKKSKNSFRMVTEKNIWHRWCPIWALFCKMSNIISKTSFFVASFKS